MLFRSAHITAKKALNKTKRDYDMAMRTVSLASNKIDNMQGQLKHARENFKKMVPQEYVTHMFEDTDKKQPRIKQYGTHTKLSTVENYCRYGASKYMYMRKSHPMPHQSTVRRWLQRIDFRPGILTPALEILKDQLPTLKKEDRFITLGFDEMSIAAKVSYDVGHMSFVGFPTIKPGKALVEKRRKEGQPDVQLATNVLSVVIGGLNLRYKMLIAYYLTDKSYDSDMFAEEIMKIKTLLTDIGYNVVHMGYDQGSTNISTVKKLSGKEK